MPTAYESLHRELLAALQAGTPETQVRTPGFPEPTYLAEFVVSDNLAGQDEGHAFAALLRIVAQAAAGKPVQAAAQAWMDEQAATHAGFHADDLVDADDEPDADAWFEARREREAVGVAA